MPVSDDFITLNKMAVLFGCSRPKTVSDELTVGTRMLEPRISVPRLCALKIGHP